jgi:hypothetical protein
MKKGLFIFLLSITSFCWGQDTLKYVSLGGKTKGIVSWSALLNSKNIELHGYPNCKIKGFCIRIMPEVKSPDDTIKKERNVIVNGGTVLKYSTAPYLCCPYGIFYSETDKITDEMQNKFKELRNEKKLRLYIYNIKIVNQKEELKWLRSFALNVQ